MTLTIEPIYIYVAVNVVLAALLIYNVRKVDQLKDEINALWQQMAIMAVASAGAFNKMEQKINENQEKQGE